MAAVWGKTWFNSECELLHKECMTIKNYLRHGCDPQYQLFHEHVKQFLKVVSNNKEIIHKKIPLRHPETKN